MTPDSIMSAIPIGLLRRRADPTEQLANSKALANWLDARGCRPSLFEIELWRARRTPTNRREVKRHRGSTTHKGESQMTSPQDSAEQAVADAAALIAARDNLSELSGEEIVDLAIGRPPGRQVRTGPHTFIVTEEA